MSVLPTRRLVLRRAGAVVVLPFLQSALPRQLRAAPVAKPPVRLVWLYAGSGMHMPDYKPAAVGRDWAVTPILEPLSPFKNDVGVLSGLFHAGAFRRNA